MKANPDRCYLLMSSDESCLAKIEDFRIKNSTFDLSFENHVTSLCTKASHKLHALTKISHYIGLNKRRNLVNTFINYQFSYCPLIWTFHSRN